MGKTSVIFWEVLRKLAHMLGLVLLVAYSLLAHYYSTKTAFSFLSGILLIWFIFEYIRVEHDFMLMRFLRRLFRSHEKKAFSGSTFYIISTIICFSLFDYWIAVVALLMMTFGDIFSAVIGRFFGITKIRKQKTIIGTLAGFAANTAAGMIVLPQFYYLILPMALCASVVEMLTDKLEDNLTVPIFAGFLGQIIVYYFSLDLPQVDLISLWS